MEKRLGEVRKSGGKKFPPFFPYHTEIEMYTNHSHIKDYKTRMQVIWSKTMLHYTGGNAFRLVKA